MLILPIKKKWFDMIVSGQKKEEYREIKPYYTSRLNNIFNFKEGFKLTDVKKDLKKYPLWLNVVFRNGYSKNSPTIQCSCKLRIGTGKEEWGAEPNKEYYILDILEVANDK